MEQLTRTKTTTVAAWLCFFVGALFGAIALWGVPRPIVGAGSFSVPAAGVAALVSAASFTASSLRHRRDETVGMPAWQRTIALISDGAVGLAFAAVAAVSVLVAGEILQYALVGFQVPVVTGAAITGAASAGVGGVAWAAGIALRTKDIATLLISFLIVGTLLAMLTTNDAEWWRLHFSQLGATGGESAWAFNGTLVIAGLLIATVGSYLGRDLHRLLGDSSLPRLSLVVAGFILHGASLAGVGLASLDRAPLIHNIIAFVTLVMLIMCVLLTTPMVRGAGRVLWLSTCCLGLGLAIGITLWLTGSMTTAAVEAVAVGIEIVWLTMVVRLLAALLPDTASRPSDRAHPLRAVPPSPNG